MAKATTIKDALKKLEETRGVNAAEIDKVGRQQHRLKEDPQQNRRSNRDSRLLQVELYGQCPPIEKMDATLSTLKACK
jgi:dynein light chain 1